MLVKKGQIIALTTGEYSDYCLRGHVRARFDFDVGERIAEFKRWEAVDEDDNPEETFVAWAIREGWVEEESEVVELYLGGYGELKPYARVSGAVMSARDTGPMAYDEIFDEGVEKWARENDWKPKSER